MVLHPHVCSETVGIGRFSRILRDTQLRVSHARIGGACQETVVASGVKSHVPREANVTKILTDTAPGTEGQQLCYFPVTLENTFDTMFNTTSIGIHLPMCGLRSCVCLRERERETEKQTERDTECACE